MEKITRTAIAEFYLVNDEMPDDRRLIARDEEVELTARQLEKYVAKGVVHGDDTLNAEAKAGADARRQAAEDAQKRAQAQVRATAEVKAKAAQDAEARRIAAADQGKPRQENVDMRTEEGEKAARAADAAATDEAAAEGQQAEKSAKGAHRKTGKR